MIAYDLEGIIDGTIDVPPKFHCVSVNPIFLIGINWIQR